MKRPILQAAIWHNLFTLVLIMSALCTPLYGNTRTIAIVPYASDKYGNLFFPQQEILALLKDLLTPQGITIECTAAPNKAVDYEAIVVWDLGKINRAVTQHPSKKYLYLWEPTDNPAEGVRAAYKRNNTFHFTWNDACVDHNTFYKLIYAQSPTLYKPAVPFQEKKLCCAFLGNKSASARNELYSARRAFLDFFKEHAPDDFDLYGPGWNTNKYPFSRGSVIDKIGTLATYKFCVCYENREYLQGYVSEKILHALYAGCVPIYRGAANITAYVPSDCFIDANKFSDHQAIYNYIHDMSPERYQEYIEARERFFESVQAQLFSSLYFCHVLLEAILPDYTIEAFHTEQNADMLRAILEYCTLVNLP